MLSLGQKGIENKLDSFNWDYKVGDNIKHNLEEVFFLYNLKSQNCETSKERQFLNKHISVVLVGLIEAILYDFVVRLSEATNHFPLTIDNVKRYEIKKYIAEQKVPYEFAKSKTKVFRVSNYSLFQVLKILKRFELLEPSSSPIYDTFEKATFFRNRIHIYNWYNNFEINERYVFTDKRLEILEKLFIYTLTTMEAKYARP